MSDVTDLIERSKRYRNENFGHGSPVGNEIMAAMEAALASIKQTDAGRPFEVRPSLERLNRPADDVLEFANAILHGDEEHRAWLLEAASLWTSGKPVPPARPSTLPKQTDAVEAERERCARIAETHYAIAPFAAAGKLIAAAIRGAK